MNDPPSRDSTLVKYIHFHFFSGEPAYAARLAVYGTAFCLALYMRIPQELALARGSLKGFERSAPEEQRDALPWEACLILMSFFITRGWKYDLLLACILPITFDGYLRPFGGTRAEGLPHRRSH